MQAMRERYPAVHLHMVSALSGHLASLLNARQLDLAILFDAQGARRWSVMPLLEEKLFLIQSRHKPVCKPTPAKTLADLESVPLILPSCSHGLRNAIVTAARQSGVQLDIALEIDGLPLLMEAVKAGMGATVQPWSAVKLHPDAEAHFQWSEICHTEVRRPATLCSLSEDELSPAALAARVVLLDCVRQLVGVGLGRGLVWCNDGCRHDFWNTKAAQIFPGGVIALGISCGVFGISLWDHDHHALASTGEQDAVGIESIALLY